MFADFGMLHLHIGDRVDTRSGLIEGADALLFVMVSGEALYMVDLVETGHAAFGGGTPRNRSHELAGVHRASARPQRGARSLEQGPMTSAERRRMRKFTMGWQAADGPVYMAIGGGAMSSGRPLIAARHLNAARHRARSLQKWAEANAAHIVERMANAGCPVADLHLQYLVGIEPPAGVAGLLQDVATDVVLEVGEAP